MTFNRIIFVAVLFAAYYIVSKLLEKLVFRVGAAKGIGEGRTHYMSFLLKKVWLVICGLILMIIVGLGYEDFGFIFSSVFAILGIALFAQWSVLSNITSSVIVFFFFPYRVGDSIRILDGENSIGGVITEIGLFHVILLGAGEERYTYPNSMVFQKAVVINPVKPQPDEASETVSSETTAGVSSSDAHSKP